MMPEQVFAGTEIALSDEVRAFCESRSIQDYLEKALELARQFFVIRGDPKIELEQDPEDGDSYLVVSIRVEGEDAACANAHALYLSAWANSVEWPTVHLIRLVHQID
jgi:hypothetical protein